MAESLVQLGAARSKRREPKPDWLKVRMPGGGLRLRVVRPSVVVRDTVARNAVPVLVITSAFARIKPSMMMCTPPFGPHEARRSTRVPRAPKQHALCRR